ncbi:MAG: hypothetical protein ACI9XU_001748, partial [Arenicella sp.]
MDCERLERKITQSSCLISALAQLMALLRMMALCFL